jgi:hypothetical protein
MVETLLPYFNYYPIRRKSNGRDIAGSYCLSKAITGNKIIRLIV